ncbi:hypothetical protein [Flavobacterium terrisoli]|uniref:hypothetical protein n=1 Tax=Flavobacterium terrisoli TaxID=3242195 RepID=UPI002543EB4E|nr:hypothetical protein [Flavobacterium buctense]
MKKELKYFLFGLIISCDIMFSQPTTEKPLAYAMSQKFVASVLDAHHTIQDFSFESTKDIRQNYGSKSSQFMNAVKADSIFKAARNNINSLLYNMSELKETDQHKAIITIQQYIKQAKELEKDKNNLPSFLDIMSTSNKFEINNTIISENFILGIEGTSASITPNNSLDVKIDFNIKIPPGNPKDYILYLFPSNWIYLEDRLFGANIGTGKNVSVFYDRLDRYAHKWINGMDNKLDKIYTGKFMLIIIDRNKNIITHFQNVLIPSDREFKYTVTD